MDPFSSITAGSEKCLTWKQNHNPFRSLNVNSVVINSCSNISKDYFFDLLQAAGCGGELQRLLGLVVASEDPVKRRGDGQGLVKIKSANSSDCGDAVAYLLARLTTENTEYGCAGTSGGRLFRWYVTSFTCEVHTIG